MLLHHLLDETWLPLHSCENKWPKSSFHWEIKPPKLWKVIWVGFQDSGRNKKSIRQTERRGRENVIDWDEDLGCLAELNLSLSLLPQTLFLPSLPACTFPFYLLLFLIVLSPSTSLSSSSALLSPTPPSSFHFLFFCCLSISKHPHKLLFIFSTFSFFSCLSPALTNISLLPEKSGALECQIQQTVSESFVSIKEWRFCAPQPRSSHFKFLPFPI